MTGANRISLPKIMAGVITVLAVAAIALFLAVPNVQAIYCPWDSTQGTCACPTSGPGVTCISPQLYSSSSASCYNDPRSCGAVNERLNCDTGVCVCDVPNYPCSGCTSAQTTVGAVCTSGSSTDASPECAEFSQHSNQCGGWACPGGTTLCSTPKAGFPGGYCVTNRVCPAGMTWDVCNDICSTPYVLLDPPAAVEPQTSAAPEISGSFTLTDGDLTLGNGDVLMASGKAIAVNAAGATVLNFGNWGGGAFMLDSYGAIQGDDLVTKTGFITTTAAALHIAPSTATINIGGGSGATGCTIDATGGLGCTGDFVEAGTALSDKYLGYDGYIQSNNPFSPRGGFYIPELFNQFHRAESRFLVTQTGYTTFNAKNLFDNIYENQCQLDPGNTGVMTIDLLAKGEFGVNGIVYPGGYIYVNFYYTRGPEFVSGRMQNRDGTWFTMSAEDISGGAGSQQWRLTVPQNNYIVKFEITIKSPITVDPNTWVTEVEYYQKRPAGAPMSFVSKYVANSVYSILYVRDSSNIPVVTLDTSGNIDATGNVSAAGNLCLGGDCIADWPEALTPGTGNGDTLRYNGTTWVANTNLFNDGTDVGIGTAIPSASLHVADADAVNPGLQVGDGVTGRVKIGLSGWYDDGTYFSPSGRSLYVRGTTPATYLYSPNTYLGSTTGQNIRLRDNNMFGDTWYINYGAGKNWGIGTTTPAYKLEVAGTLGVTGNAIFSGASTSVMNTFATYGSTIIGNEATDALTVNSSAVTVPNGLNFDSNTLVIDAVNNRIGIGTAAPAFPLHVMGTASVTGFRMPTGAGAGLAMVSDAAGNASWSPLGGIGGGGTPNYVAKFTAASTLGDSVIYDNGTNVGIGTTTPFDKLHVADGSLYLGPDFFDGIYGKAIRIGWEGDVDVYHSIQTTVSQGGAASNGMRFYVHGGGAVDNQVLNLALTGSGNVGIGTTAPDYTLDVAGNIGLDALLRHNGDANTYVNFTGDRMRGYIGGKYLLDLYEAVDDHVKLGDGSDVDIYLSGGADPALFVEGSSARVGVGTNLPGYRMDVRSNVSTSLPIVSITDEDATMDWTGLRLARGAAPTESWFIGMDDSTDLLKIRGNSTFDSIVVNPDTGGVGIGTNMSLNWDPAFGWFPPDWYGSEMALAMGGYILSDFWAGSDTNTLFGYNTAGAGNMRAANNARYNTVIGYGAGYDLTSGWNNTLIGTDAGANITSSVENVMIGLEAGLACTGAACDNNIFIGSSAGDQTTSGQNNIILGENMQAPLATTSNFLNIGNVIYSEMASTFVGIGTNNPNYTLDVNGTANVTGFRMPTGAGAGLVMTSDASGNASWGALAGITGGGTPEKIAKFTAGSTLGDSIMTEDPINGRIGIGTAVPNYTLEVAGDIGVFQHLYRNGDANTYVNLINDEIRLVAGGLNLVYANEDGTQDYVQLGNGGDVDIRLSGGANPALFVEGSSGNVAVGTATPVVGTALTVSKPAINIGNTYGADINIDRTGNGVGATADRAMKISAVNFAGVSANWLTGIDLDLVGGVTLSQGLAVDVAGGSTGANVFGAAFQADGPGTNLAAVRGISGNCSFVGSCESTGGIFYANGGATTNVSIGVKARAMNAVNNYAIYTEFGSVSLDDDGQWWTNMPNYAISSGELFARGDIESDANLYIAGTANVGGFRMSTGGVVGRVLTSDGSGIGTWQAPVGDGIGVGGSGTVDRVPKFTGATTLGDSLITDNGTSIGINDTTPSYRLDVAGTGRFTSTLQANGALVVNGNTTLGNASTDTVTVNAATVSADNGLNFDANTLVLDATNNRIGILNIAPTHELDVTGSVRASNDLWALDDAFISDDLTVGGTLFKVDDSASAVGVNTTTPAYTLDVNGTANMTGFRMPTGAVAGRVLTSDAGGIGTWQAPVGDGIGVGGNGNANYIPKFTAGTTLANSIMFQHATLTYIGINDITPSYTLDVAGTGRFTSTLQANGALVVNGNTTLGNASTDLITSNADTLRVPNGLYVDYGGGADGGKHPDTVMVVQRSINDAAYLQINAPAAYERGLLFGENGGQVNRGQISYTNASGMRFYSYRNPDYIALTLEPDGDLNADGGTLFVDYSANMVGILDTTPSYQLDVTGTVRATNDLRASDDAFILDDLTVGGSLLFVDDSLSMVGIQDLTPSYTLDVNGNIRATGDLRANDDLFVTDDATISDDLNVGGGLLFVDDSLSRVGVNTTTPVSTFQVIGDGSFSGNLFGNYIFGNDGSITQDWTVNGDTYSGGRLTVSVPSITPTYINRRLNDGNLIYFQQDTSGVGSISVAGSTVSYNPFTGSHYAWTEEVMEKGTLVSLTGQNRFNGRPIEGDVEPVYGIKTTTFENDSRVLGAYLTPPDTSDPEEVSYDLVMAVGNGSMWIVDEGKDIEVGDFLISSSTAGHARIDPGTHDVSHVIGMATESVDWGEVTTVAPDGKKHMKISVVFERFEKLNLTWKIDLEGRLEKLDEVVRKIEQSNVELKSKTEELEARIEQIEWQLLND